MLAAEELLDVPLGHVGLLGRQTEDALTLIHPMKQYPCRRSLAMRSWGPTIRLHSSFNRLAIFRRRPLMQRQTGEGSIGRRACRRPSQGMAQRGHRPRPVNGEHRR